MPADLPLAATLWLPLDAGQVAQHAARRYPGAAWRDGRLPLGKYGYLTEGVGPDADGNQRWLLHAPIERAGPMPAPHGTGLAAAYPAGIPKRAERRHLDWALARPLRRRRLVTADGVDVVPDDLPPARDVVARVWLTPAATFRLATRAGAPRYLPTAPGAPMYVIAVADVVVDVRADGGQVTYRIRHTRTTTASHAALPDATAVVDALAGAIARATGGSVFDERGLMRPNSA